MPAARLATAPDLARIMANLAGFGPGDLGAGLTDHFEALAERLERIAKELQGPPDPFDSRPALCRGCGRDSSGTTVVHADGCPVPELQALGRLHREWRG